MYTITETEMQSGTRSENIPSLAEEAKNDPAAFGRLYEHYVQPVYRYLYSRIGSIHEAEDLTSQTFIAAYEALPRYRERGHFEAWLFRIAQNKLMDSFRRSKPEVDLDRADSPFHSGELLGGLIRDEELSRLKSLIQSLNVHEQDLIHLRYVAELPFSEIAEILGKREDAVKKSIYRLLARLRAQME